MIWALGAVAILLASLLLEAALIRRAVNAVPERILVTGTRGKSAVVKALSAGIRAGEPATWGKITGDVASLIAPDGTMRALKRRGPAHLREQGRVVRACRDHGARCLVVESMAISPEAMAAEVRLLRPALVVVTNVRDDHRETLGGDPAGQRDAYLSSIPAGRPWLTRDEDLVARARSAGYPAPVPFPAPEGTDPGPGEDDAYSETVATAEAALAVLGRNTESARRAVRDAAAGATARSRVVTLRGREMILMDAFSANDPESLESLWTNWRRTTGATSLWSVLLNTRADRPLRTRRFCHWVAARRDVDCIYAAGSHAPAAMRMLRGLGLRVEPVPRGEPVPVSRAGGRPAPGGSDAVIVGIGNASGLGLHLRAALEREGRR